MLVEQEYNVLQATEILVGYGQRPVVKDVSFDLRQSEILAVIGHNGAGKSTLLNSLFGVIPLWHGTVQFGGQPLRRPNPRDLISKGVCLVPQGNRVFLHLTVRQNLMLSAVIGIPRAEMRSRLDSVLSTFPKLVPKLHLRAQVLSGGERQMLALSSAVIHNPKVLLMDEPSLGLSPKAATEMFNRTKHLVTSRGLSAVIVEQRVRNVLEIADRVLILRSGTVGYLGTADELLSDAQLLRQVYL